MLQGEVEENCGDFEIIEGLGPYQLTRDETLKVVVRFAPRSPGLLTCAVEFNNPLCPSVQCRGIGTREQTWYVAADGSGDAPTIQAAIDSSVNGDTVLVGPGTYFEEIGFGGKLIDLRSERGPDLTFIDGTYANGPLIRFEGGESERTVLEGFTIANGRYRGIQCQAAASPVIRGNRFYRNLAAPERDGHGGAIAISPPADSLSNVSILENIFEENESRYNGGAISVGGEGIKTIRGNVFRGNRSGTDGGALFFYGYGTGSIENNQFVENVAGDHGGACEIGASVTIRFNLFLRNQAKATDGPTWNGTGGALSIRGGEDVFVENNTFVANQTLGSEPCSGGAVLLSPYVTHLWLTRNIFFKSSGCAVGCSGPPQSNITALGNIFWQDSPGTVSPTCGINLDNTNAVIDPLFCSPDGDDYRVMENSPALVGPIPVGAFPVAGCVSGAYVKWGGRKTGRR